MYWINKDQLLHTVLQFIFCFLICNALDKDAETELSITAVQGGLAALPCSTSSRAQIALIIWYRANSEVPIYTIDLRAAGAHKHTSNTTRLRFDLDRRTLYVHNVSRALDQTRFRCRVDYRKHRSENTFVQLNVTVPPKSVTIVDSEGQKLEGTIGPFKENSNLRLICEAEGGDPQPKLKWRRGSTNLQATSSSQIRFVRSELEIRNLTRLYLGVVLSCVASIGTVSIDTSVQLDLNLRPLSAQISLERSLANDTNWSNSWSSNQMNSTLNRVKNKLNAQTLNKTNRTKLTSPLKRQTLQLVDGQPVEIYCEVIGSRPAPTFSWYLGDQKLPSNHYTQWPPSNSRASPTNSLSTRSTTSFNHNYYSAQPLTATNNKSINANNLNPNALNSNSFTDPALISNQHLAISTLHFKPTYESDGKQLTCRSENPLLSDQRLSSVEHHVQLDVQYSPRLRIQLGANLRRIRETTDVYIECESHSNPRLNEQIQWYFLREPSLSATHSNTRTGSSILQTSDTIVNNSTAIERIFNKHVPSSSRASHVTSLLFLDSTSADSWINRQQLSTNNNKNNLLDEDWLSLSTSYTQQNNQINSKTYEQIDLKHFQLVTGGTNIIVADSSLVLQKVQRTQRGLYVCSAANSRGRTFSKPIFLDVNYAPICEYPTHSLTRHSPLSVSNQDNIHHHVHNHYSINDNNFPNQQSSKQQPNSYNNQIIVNPLNGEPVKCTVDSVPSSSLKFHWMLSLSSGQSPNSNLDSNQRKLNQYTTVAHSLKNISSIFILQDAFLTSTHKNAQLLCWADNDIGPQKVPCVFNIVKAGPPEPLKSCSVSNETTESLLIYCILGGNGGLESRFHLEVFDGSGQFVAGQSTQCNSSNNEFLDKVNSNKYGLSIHKYNQPSLMHDQSAEEEQRNRIVFLTSNCNVDKAEAVLLLSNLEAHQQYTLVAYAENSKGRSESLKFTASTVDVPAKHTALGDKIQTTPNIGSLFGALVIMSFGICSIPIMYLLKRRRRRSRRNSPTDSPNINLNQGKLQQSVATVTNYLTDNVCVEDTFDSEKYNSSKLKVLERPLQTSPNTLTSGHVSITGTNHHFGNEITGITSLNSISTASPTALLTSSSEPVTNGQYNQLSLVDYYGGDQYLNSSNQWPVAHSNTDTLFMQLGEHQLVSKLISNAHPQGLHLHPPNNAALLINAHHQSLYSNSPALLTPNTNLNSPNIELATLTRQNIYRTLNKRPNDELLNIPQSTSMLLNTHQLQPLNNKLNPSMLNELEQ